MNWDDVYNVVVRIRAAYNFPPRVESCRRAKVDQLDVARPCDEHVLRFNVAMHETKFVEVVQTCSYLCQIEPARSVCVCV